MDIYLIAKLLGALSGIVGACGVLWLKVFKPLFTFGSNTKAQWDKVVSELTPNGGSSIKDAIGRIETRQLIEVQVRKALSNDSLSGVWEMDAEGKMTYANRTYQRIVGSSYEDLDGWGWTNSIHKDDRTTVVNEVRTALEQHRELNVQFRVVKFTEETVLVCMVGHPLKDRAGSLKGFVGQLVTRAQEDDVFYCSGD
jgi:PAS domain S-box-containing protein